MGAANPTLTEIRITLQREINRLRETIDDDTEISQEMTIRAQLSGLEWAMSQVLRVQMQEASLI